MADNIKKAEATQEKSPKVEKYLTNIKELPTFSSEKTASSKKKTEYKTHVVEKQQAAEKPKQNEKQTATPAKAKAEQEEKGTEPVAQETEENVSEKPYSTKDIILGVVNVVTLVLLFIFLSKLSAQADRLKDLKNEIAISQSPIQLELSDVQKGEVKTDELNNFFVDEPGVVQFVNDVEKLRNENSSQIQVSFASQKAVKDKTENFGIPVVISFRGSWEQIDNDIGRVQALPYLFRSVKITSKVTDDPSVIELKYGIVLYVKDELGQD
jgi:hypothetical protein